MQLTAWTTYEELTEDQRSRFGEYVRARDEVRARVAYNMELDRRAAEALKTTGGNKQSALAMILAGRG